MNSFRSQYLNNGFVIIKNVIPKKKIANLKKTFDFLSKKFLGLNYSSNKKKFLTNYISLRKNNPKLCSYLYDSLTTSYALQNLIFDKNIQLHIKNVLDEKSENLSHFFRCLRIDTPQENPNELGWHQDVQDDSRGQINQIDGLTLWAPLTIANLNQGSMEMCLSSHFKKINNIKFSKKNQFQSKYINIPNKFSMIYDKIIVNANPGDCVLMNMNTLHRSVTSLNPKAELRLTVIARFFKFSSKNYLPGSQRFVASKN